MKQQSLRWRFVNQTNPSETVVVHDENSAQTLASLLQKMGGGGEWIMQEERPLGSIGLQSSQAPAAPQPQAVETSQDVSAQPNMAQEILEAVVTAAHQDAQEAAEQHEVVPPPAPKKTERRERRHNQRYMTEFRVILISGSSSFRTMSQDVSLGGMRLKKTIPEAFLKEKCIAYVSHKDLRENIEIVCNVVGDPSDPCRIKFLQPNQSQLQRLNDWLMEHNQGGAPRGNKAS